MLFLGLLLLACTAAFVGLAIADNLGGGPHYDVSMLGHTIATMNGLALFCAGLALALIFGLGLMMAIGGAAVRRRNGRRLRAARRDMDATGRERDELAARLDRMHEEHVAADGGALAADREGDFAATRESDLENNRDMTTGNNRDMTTGPDTASGGEQAKPRHRHARHLFGH
jgi:hypothetical protein